MFSTSRRPAPERKPPRALATAGDVAVYGLGDDLRR